MDLRIIKTKELIRRVFVGLLQEREFPQITVKELCIRARINRSTFYHHYEDIYALRDELIDSVIDEYTAHMETAFLDIHTFLSDDYPRLLTESLVYMHNHRNLYELLWRQKLLGRNVFEEMLAAGSSFLTNRILESGQVTPAKKKYAGWYANLLINNLMTSTRWWLHQEPPIPAEQMAEMIASNMHSGTVIQLLT